MTTKSSYTYIEEENTVRGNKGVMKVCDKCRNTIQEGQEKCSQCLTELNEANTTNLLLD